MSHPLPPQAPSSGHHGSQKILRPVLERNGPPAHPLGQGSSGLSGHAQSQQIATASGVLGKSAGASSAAADGGGKTKKLRGLPQSAAHQGQEKQLGSEAQRDRGSARGGRGTPSRNDTRSRQRSRDPVVETQALLARRISQHSPTKRNRGSNASQTAHQQ